MRLIKINLDGTGLSKDNTSPFLLRYRHFCWCLYVKEQPPKHSQGCLGLLFVVDVMVETALNLAQFRYHWTIATNHQLWCRLSRSKVLHTSNN
jgi:hypothetical protein